MSTYADKIGELKKRASDIASQLAALMSQRKSYALAAADGDERAKKQIADADFQLDALKKEAQTLDSAIETAEALDRQHALEAEQQADAKRQVEAYTSASAICTLNEEIDMAMAKLRDCFARRAALLAGLAATDSMTVARLSNKSGPTRAACHHNLDAFIAIERPAAGSRSPLASANSILLGIGKAPEADTKRVKLKERAS